MKGWFLVVIYKDKDINIEKELVGTFICPECGEEVGLAGDQLRGEISTQCINHCPFHVWIKHFEVFAPLRVKARYE